MKVRKKEREGSVAAAARRSQSKSVFLLRSIFSLSSFFLLSLFDFSRESEGRKKRERNKSRWGEREWKKRRSFGKKSKTEKKENETAKEIRGRAHVLERNSVGCDGGKPDWTESVDRSIQERRRRKEINSFSSSFFFHGLSLERKQQLELGTDQSQAARAAWIGMKGIGSSSEIERVGWDWRMR